MTPSMLSKARGSKARGIGDAFYGAIITRFSTTAVWVGLEARQQVDCLVGGGRKPDQTSMQ